MTQETEKPNAPYKPAQGKPKIAREVYQQKIARNSKWHETTMAGGGYIIGGPKPPEQRG